MAHYSETAEEIKKHFNFLCSELGCAIAKEEIDNNGAYITYTNEVAGLRVSFERLDGGVFVMVFKLKDHKIPPYEGSGWMDIIDLLNVKGVEFVEPNVKNFENPEPKELRRVLTHFADNVRIHAQSFLQGDFSIIEKVEKIIEERRKELGH